MKIAQKLLISDKTTFDQLTSEEQNLWTKFKTGDIYRFLTGEEDTVPEFQYNWTSVPKLQPLESTTTTTAPAPTNAPLVAPPQLPPAPASPPDIGQSPSTASSTLHSSPTPSTTGTRPKQTAPAPTKPQQPDPSGALTFGHHFYFPQHYQNTQPDTATKGRLQGTQHGCSTIWERPISEKMLSGRSLSQKIRRQGQKNFTDSHRFPEIPHPLLQPQNDHRLPRSEKFHRFPPISRNSSSSSTATK
jgi:hypothetical protein